MSFSSDPNLLLKAKTRCLSEDGFAFSLGTVSKRLTQFFQQAGIRRDVRVKARNIRKMISDKTYEMSPTKKHMIHGHMKHQEKTADANYVTRLNADRAVKAHQLMQDIIHKTTPSAPAEPSPVDETAPGKPDDTSPVDKTTTSKPAKPSPVKDTAASKPAHPRPKGKEEVSDSDDCSDNQPLAIVLKMRMKMSLSDESGIVSAATPSVLSLGDDHKSVLLTVFQKDISTGNYLQWTRCATRCMNICF